MRHHLLSASLVLTLSACGHQPTTQQPEGTSAQQSLTAPTQTDETEVENLYPIILPASPVESNPSGDHANLPNSV